MPRRVSAHLTTRTYTCPECRATTRKLAWDYDAPPICQCQTEMVEGESRFGRAPSVIGDEIDIEVRHGICHDDGTPRRFTSKSEMRRVAQQKGLVLYGETPK